MDGEIGRGFVNCKVLSRSFIVAFLLRGFKYVYFRFFYFLFRGLSYTKERERKSGGFIGIWRRKGLFGFFSSFSFFRSSGGFFGVFVSYKYVMMSYRVLGFLGR